ncbi:hypothetical protein VRRI112168_02385 [Vreelandella rituensis]|uniref:Uncharacterized protein n=1 Tax=Vreelandella rituensis TaxID=2282306 RepID=A0A368U9H4_9GAMM|nr:hypothetical protein [Halomonas rituensis]RCV93595.1 hypothetical protein DU506_00125 [Halomonas rituensis]
MALHLEQFVAEVKTDIDAFAADYKAQHAANPEHYPLELNDDNAGLWTEFFMDFIVLRGKPGCFSTGRDSASCAARLGVPCPRLLFS